MHDAAGRAALAALEAASGVPVIGMESPRGIADASLGAFAQVLPQADCVLLVGKRLDFTLTFGEPPFPAAAEVHRIDAEPVEFDRTRARSACVCEALRLPTPRRVCRR